MPIAFTLAFAGLLAAASAPPGPTVAREDTMQTSVPEVLVRAPRVTLDEILDRVARGEARRDSLLHDQTFVATTRLVRNVAAGGKPPELFMETVTRVYRKRPGKARTVLLRRYEAHPDKKKNKGMTVTFGSGMDEDVVNFAFRPAARRDFKYKIAGRDLVGDHLVYRIAFEPRSLLDPSNPSGEVWIDTNEFVIVRQEISFRHSPAPLILRGVPRMVVERRNVDGFWVLSRILMRAEFTVPIPKFGRSFDISVLYDRYAMNTGLADSLFTTHAAIANPAGAE